MIEDGIIEPIGSGASHKVDVRIISATNRDLPSDIRAGLFREDLYYRLNRGEISLPPLRQRQSDIPKIALHILDRVNAGIKNSKRIHPDALSALAHHQWPGNVRALENVIERSALFAKHSVITVNDLAFTETDSSSNSLPFPVIGPGFSLESYLSEIRNHLYTEALAQTGGNKSAAARLLGVSPQAVGKFRKDGTASI